MYAAALKAASKAKEKASSLASEVSDKGITSVVSSAASDLKNTVKEDGVYNTMINTAKAAKNASIGLVADCSDSGWKLKALIGLEKDDATLFHEALALDLSGSVYSWSLGHKLAEQVGFENRADGIEERKRLGMNGMILQTPVVLLQDVNQTAPSLILTSGIWPTTLRQLATRCKKKNCLKVLDAINQVMKCKLVIYQRKIDGLVLLLDVLSVGNCSQDDTLMFVKEKGMVSSESCWISPLFVEPFVCSHDETCGVEYWGLSTGYVCGKCKQCLNDISLINCGNDRILLETSHCNRIEEEDMNILLSYALEVNDDESKDNETILKMKAGQLSISRGVTVKWLLDFTLQNDCWEWSTMKVRDDIVWPATATITSLSSSTSSPNRTTRCRYTDILQEHELVVGNADIFVSHAWAARWGDLVQGILSTCALTTRVWIDIFAVRQWPGNVIDLNFEEVVKLSKGMLVINSAIPSISNSKLDRVLLSCRNDFDRELIANKSERKKIGVFRVWCLVELAAARNYEIPIVMITGKRKQKNSTSKIYHKINQYTQNLTNISLEEKKKVNNQSSILEDYDWQYDKLLLIKLLFMIDIDQSECAFQRDKENLFNKVLKICSIEEFDAHVRGTVIGSLGISENPLIGRAAFGDSFAMNTILNQYSIHEKYEALCIACFGGWLHVVTQMIENGSNSLSVLLANQSQGGGGVGGSEFQKNHKHTPLCAAAAGGHYKVCEYLINKMKVNVNEKCPFDHTTPIMYAAQSGNVKLVELLLSKGANQHVGRLNSEKKSPLGHCDAFFCAVQLGNLSCLKALVADQSDFGSFLFYNCRDESSGEYLIHCAAQAGNTNIIEYLISVCILQNSASSSSSSSQEDPSLLLDLRTESEFGMTPLMFAANMNHTSTVKTLIQAGADATLITQNGFSALHFACIRKYNDSLVSENLKATNQMKEDKEAEDLKNNLLTSDDEQTIVEVNQVQDDDDDVYHEVIMMLVEAGCDVNDDSGLIQGWTPLFWAANSHHHVAIKTLLLKGAEINHTCSLGTNALMQCITVGKPIDLVCKTVSMLLDAGIDINARDRCSKKTALKETQLFVYGNRLKKVSNLLISKGALSLEELDLLHPDLRTNQQKIDDMKLAMSAYPILASKFYSAVGLQYVNGIKNRVILPTWNASMLFKDAFMST